MLPPSTYGDGGPGGWWILDEPELHLGADILVPDLAGWRRESMPRLPTEAYFTTPPDWVCEVLSPSTSEVDLEEKRPIYAREGVGHLWFVDPVAQELEAFELRDGGWVQIASLSGDDPVSVPPFDAITFSLGDLWEPEVKEPPTGYAARKPEPELARPEEGQIMAAIRRADRSVQRRGDAPARQKADRPATYQDVLDAPEHMVAEVIGGVLYTHSKSTPLHARARSGMVARIASPFHFGDGGPGGWLILNKPELHLGADILVPDLAGWRRESMPRLPTEAYFTTPPDWVCEVLSPSTSEVDLEEKRPIYAREGVGHLWFVDSVAQELEAFELRDGGWVQIASLSGDDPVSVPPFDAITFSLGDLWWPESVIREPSAHRAAKSAPAD